MGSEEQCSIDTQEFLNIQAALLAPSVADAATEAPRASGANRASTAHISLTRANVNPLDDLEKNITNLNQSSFRYITQPSSDRQGQCLPVSNALNHGKSPSPNTLTRKRGAHGIPQSTTKSLKIRRHKPKSGTMDAAQQDGGPTTSTDPDDTQIMPTQVYADYFNPEKKPDSSIHVDSQPSSFGGSLDTTTHAYKTGDIGHVNIAAETQANGYDLDGVSPVGSEIDQNQTQHEHDEDENTVTSPVAPSPITPAVYGRKHDREGNILAHQPYLQSHQNAVPQDLGALFKAPQTKAAVGLSQVFQQTQAATSPMLDDVRSDPVFERPSPDFRGIHHFSSPTFSSPDLSRTVQPEASIHGPKKTYVPMKQSQERRQREKPAQVQLSDGNEDDEHDFGQDSMEEELSRRRRRAEIEAKSREQLAAFGTSSSSRQYVSTVITPAAKPNRQAIIEISDDTPTSIMEEAGQDSSSDAASVDEFDELSQAVINRISTTSRHKVELNPRVSSPLPESTAQPLKHGHTLISSDTKLSGQLSHPNQLQSQSVKVANSQPDRLEKLAGSEALQAAAGTHQSESSDQFLIVPQSQATNLAQATETNTIYPSQGPESSSASADMQDYFTSETNRGGQEGSASPDSSPPVNIPINDPSQELNESDVDLSLEHSTTDRPDQRTTNRGHRTRIISDPSPSSPANPPNAKREYTADSNIPSASLPESASKNSSLKGRPLARSHSTSKFETARSNQSSSRKSSLRKSFREQESRDAVQLLDSRLAPARTDLPHNGAANIEEANTDPEDAEEMEDPPISGLSSQENNPPSSSNPVVKARQTRSNRPKPAAPTPPRKLFRISGSQDKNRLLEGTEGKAQQLEPQNPLANSHAVVGTSGDGKTSYNRMFSDRVFARFKDPKMLYYPATCVSSRDGSSFTIQYDDKIVDNDVPNTVVKALELRPGDIVKVDRPALRKNEYIVRDLCDAITPDHVDQSYPVLVDVFGHQTVILEVKQSIGSTGNDTSETIQVPVAEIYLTNQLFARLIDRPAPVQGFTNDMEGVLTPLDGQSRPGTPPSRNRRYTTQASKRPSLVGSYSTLNSYSGLFSNMVFAITQVADKDVDEKKATGERNLAMKLIVENGGRLISTGFEEMFESLDMDDLETRNVTGGPRELKLKSTFASSGFTALITNSYSRSTKFIQALALNIPCLSIRWIIDSVEAKANLPWSRYLLPAGKSRVLGDAVRSRTFSENGMPTLEAKANKLAGIISHRPTFLQGQNIIMITGKSKIEQERRQTYVFLCYALSAERVECVKDIEAAKLLIRQGRGKWDILGVDEEAVEDTKSALAAGANARYQLPIKGNKSKTRNSVNSSVAKIQEERSELVVKVVGTEFLVQSLIMGALIE